MGGHWWINMLHPFWIHRVWVPLRRGSSLSPLDISKVCSNSWVCSSFLASLSRTFRGLIPPFAVKTTESHPSSAGYIICGVIMCKMKMRGFLFKNYYAFQDGASRILNQLWNLSRHRACVTAQVYVHDASPTFKRRRVVKILSSNHSPPQDFLSKLFCSSLSLLVIIILSHRVIMEYK